MTSLPFRGWERSVLRAPRVRGSGGIPMARRFLRTAGVAGVAVATTATVTPAATSSPHPGTATPIRHVIVIIGENHSFGNVFATYQPPHGQHIGNLLSEWI